jgi:hypothetical protein
MGRPCDFAKMKRDLLQTQESLQMLITSLVTSGKKPGVCVKEETGPRGKKTVGMRKKGGRNLGARVKKETTSSTKKRKRKLPSPRPVAIETIIKVEQNPGIDVCSPVNDTSAMEPAFAHPRFKAAIDLQLLVPIERAGAESRLQSKSNSEQQRKGPPSIKSKERTKREREPCLQSENNRKRVRKDPPPTREVKSSKAGEVPQQLSHQTPAKMLQLFPVPAPPHQPTGGQQVPTDLMMGMVGGAPESLDELCTDVFNFEEEGSLKHLLGC